MIGRIYNGFRNTAGLNPADISNGFRPNPVPPPVSPRVPAGISGGRIKNGVVGAIGVVGFGVAGPLGLVMAAKSGKAFENFGKDPLGLSIEVAVNTAGTGFDLLQKALQVVAGR